MSSNVGSFTDLKVWQEAQKLLKIGYAFSLTLPSDEKHNRTFQLKRSLSSVPANISEGYGRFHWQENIQFCRQARGSLEESRNHILAAIDLDQGDVVQAKGLLEQIDLVSKLLNGYIRFLSRKKVE